MLDQAQLQHYIDAAGSELQNNILPFWLQHAVDTTGNGFYGRVSQTLIADPRAPRGAMLCARILWTYSAAYLRYGNPIYRDMARRAYDDLLAHFWDNTYSGFYWSTDGDRNVLGADKEVVAQAYGMYALAEYFRATAERPALDTAIALFHLVDEQSWDWANGGYFDACTRDWQFKTNRRPKQANKYKSLNPQLHALEAYTNLMRVWDSAELRERQASLLTLMMHRMIDAQTYHTRARFDERWNALSERVSFGHDIETSWLLTEAAEVLGNGLLREEARGLAVHMAQVTYSEGLDRDGGLFFEAERGRIRKPNKEWWPQAEAVVGFINAYQLSSEPHFLEAAFRSWDFIAQHLVDPTHGEWFKHVNSKGLIDRRTPKVSFWKCPYHNSRACMELIDRLQALVAAQEKRVFSGSYRHGDQGIVMCE